MSDLSTDLLGAATWSAPVSRPQLNEFATRALQLESALEAESSNANYWHNEVLRLREELRAATDGHLGD